MPELTEEGLANLKGLLENAKISNASTDVPHQDAKFKEPAKTSASSELEEKNVSLTTTEETSRVTEKPALQSGLSEFEVEVIRGLGPSSNSLKDLHVAPKAQRQAAEEAVYRAGEDTTRTVVDQSPSVITTSSSAMDKTGFHAIIPINDWPWKERWRVTNKEIMARLIETTGASVTYGGVFYQPNKEYPVEGPPKLHLLIESNEEWRVEQAVRDIKRLVIESPTTHSVRDPLATTDSES